MNQENIVIKVSFLFFVVNEEDQERPGLLTSEPG